jgi:hypothetical protein
MDRLRKIIEQHGRWIELGIYIERIQAHSATDFSAAFENAKSLLEAIGKEICSVKGIDLEATASTNAVLKKAFSCVGYSGSHMVTQISSALATIAQQMGELRNDIGITSHGRSLEEIRQRNEAVDVYTREFLIDTTVIVASFLIRSFETENPRTAAASVDPSVAYADNEDFNEYWDELYGSFDMGDYSYTASEILFGVDSQAYETEQKAFLEVKKSGQ